LEPTCGTNERGLSLFRLVGNFVQDELRGS
jgi:hypothetical protein